MQRIKTMKWRPENRKTHTRQQNRDMAAYEREDDRVISFDNETFISQIQRQRLYRRQIKDRED